MLEAHVERQRGVWLGRLFLELATNLVACSGRFTRARPPRPDAHLARREELPHALAPDPRVRRQQAVQARPGLVLLDDKGDLASSHGVT